LRQAIAYMHSDPKGVVEIAKKEFLTLEPGIVDAAVHRMLTEGAIDAK
jgi:NitT/TauT family transport system substrate-binding protein